MTVRSLFVGYSGLNAMSHNIDVIGNNIANVNTVGYRAGRATFDDIFYQTLFSGVGSNDSRGGINPMQIGTGAQLASVDTVFTQGSTQNTGRLLDLAINGEGFFVLRNGAGQEYLTRAGNFSLDNDGFIVDPTTGYRLIGTAGDENGELQDNAAPGELQIDFQRRSLAQETQNVKAGGNFNSEVGQSVDVLQAQSTTNLLGLFDRHGEAFGLVNGDVLRFDSGYFELSDPPTNVQSPIDLSKKDIGKGAGVIMSITSTTTIADLQKALKAFFGTTMSDVSPGAESGIDVLYNGSGNFEINNFGTNALSGIRMGVAPRGSLENPPEQANRLIGELFTNEVDPKNPSDLDLTKTLNVGAGETVKTNSLRRADRTTSIDVFDSKGNAHTLTVGMAADTHAPAATENTLVKNLRDSEGRFIIPGGVVPPKPQFSEPILDAANNTAVYTATQISNVVATQGVFSFQDGSGNLVALRFSDGALSFNGGAFQSPIGADETVSSDFTGDPTNPVGIDVTGDSFLNIPHSGNSGGGLLGDEGLTETTTLEDIRKGIETRLNAAIRQVASNIVNIPPTTGLTDVPQAGFTTPAEIPQIKVNLTKDGSFTFSAIGGHIGAGASDSDDFNQQLIANAGGEEKMGLVLDLAAKTRSIRVSMRDSRGTPADPTDDFGDGAVDEDFTDGGGITGFLKSGDPFSSDLSEAFAIGNTDFEGLVVGDPTGDPPTGVNDSDVRLIALSSGTYSTADSLTDQGFDGATAFTPETTVFQTLFNKRGYGVAANFDETSGVDRPAGVPIGIVSRSTDTQAFETNTIRQDGLMRNTVNYQVVVPNDYRTIPNETTGQLVFNSQGRFVDYSGDTDAPIITFDPDDGDPAGGGVDPITFKLDMSGITHFSQSHSAQLQSQDGRPVGNLENVSITNNGEIIGVFTNGDTQSLGQIMLGNVTNPGGLTQVGNTLFTEGPNSGERIFLEAGNGAGVVTSGTLELSNVDLAQEFTNLIVAQRAFQANARTITTGDQILTEIVSLKR